MTSDACERLKEELRDSLRCGYLFGNCDEPLGEHGKRIVRVILTMLERWLQ